MAKFVVVIDAQNDFITGNLGSDEALEAYDRIKDYITNWPDNEDVFIFTQDTHEANDYAGSIEGQRVVNHCRKDCWGWKIPGALRDLFEDNPYTIEKSTFGSFQLPIQMKEVFQFREDMDEIEICGFCTDICVISNALILRAAFPGAKISVLANLCAGTTPINHVNALEVMKSNLIEVRYLVDVSQESWTTEA